MGIAQEPCQLSIALLQRAGAPVAVKLDQVEGIEHDMVVVALAVELVKVRAPVIAAHDRLAVEWPSAP